MLVLPSDVQGLWYRMYLRVPKPKSRWAGARRQLARVDDWWVTAMAEKLLGRLSPAQRIWPLSAGAFRKRWDAIARVLHVPSHQGSGLTPASLRGGGATSFYELSEDIDLLRRRARWSAVQSAEIYVQEVAPYEFLSGMSRPVRDLIFRVAEEFVPQVQGFLAA